MRRVNTLIIGSGAAGLAAAVRLHAAGVTDIAIYTEGLRMGTSINTGSDKQTYYKLGMYGMEADSPRDMALDLARGGSAHGDIALVEAALSPYAFHHLAALGVPFPHDCFGQHIGYKTDHDPKRRATSCGPYTSREMCLALIAEVQRREIPVFEHRVAVQLLVRQDSAGASICCGGLFVNQDADASSPFECILAQNVIFATGGPGGLYSGSVYPKVHTGSIGLAIAAGAKTRNLPESQFGMASTAFRWNVSGSYMQVLPRFISTAADGVSDEREFLREYFSDLREMYDMIFLKGYQWPFAAGHLPGSSLIDILVDIEINGRGRRVFLDYRRDPADFTLAVPGEECSDYLRRSGALADTPFKRLEQLNAPAIQLYRQHHIDLETQPLEIAVCAQHNNGGLAGNIWWESENIRGLFPIGEVNGSHGVTRPGGSALNAGQVGAFRAAEYIAACRCDAVTDEAEEADRRCALSALAALQERCNRSARLDWRKERQIFQQRMSRKCAFIRQEAQIAEALQEAVEQLDALKQDGLDCGSAPALAEALRNIQLLTAQLLYLETTLKQVQDGVGSRGSALVLAAGGKQVHPALSEQWCAIPEDTAFRNRLLTATLHENGAVEMQWEEARPVPHTDGWFENIWRDFRNHEIYGENHGRQHDL